MFNTFFSILSFFYIFDIFILESFSIFLRFLIDALFSDGCKLGRLGVTRGDPRPKGDQRLDWG